MISYRDFDSVDQLRKYYGLDNTVNEAKDKTKKDDKTIIINDDDKDKKKDTTAAALPLKKPSSEIMKDPVEVVYSKDIYKYTNIFKKIVVLTNNRKREENKTLDNIYEAVDNLKKDKCPVIPEILVFVADETDADIKDDGTIVIKDSKLEWTITDESNADTLVISRLGVQDTPCEQVVFILQDRGFLVLNPIRYSKLASDKYETAVLLDKAGIPQPYFDLVTKDVLYNEERWAEILKELHPGVYGKDEEKDKDLEYVVKILDGHGGTGVACFTGKQLYPALQLVFAIDPDVRLIIQSKEEADGGDIRVHVLTLRNKQRILAAMKRVKIKGDFRSNVSLGATAEKVTLTPEQEQIALKAAKVSRLPWCAVDIMPLVKGSNPKLGDNVVLELNASPGTDGISEVMDENFINLLLFELNSPDEFYIQDKTAGYQETMYIDLGAGEVELLARLDTGNGSVAGHFEVGDYTEDGKKIAFKLFGKEYTFDINGHSKSWVGDQQYDRVIIIVPSLRIGQRRLTDVKMGVVKNRTNKSTNALINRDVLSKLGYIIDSAHTHLLTPEIEKVKIY